MPRSVMVAACVVGALGTACGRVGFAEVKTDGGSSGGPSDGAQCPPNFTDFDGYCYRYSDVTEEWLNAELRCEADAGAHLAVVDDPTESAVIVTLPFNAVLWVGASDRIVEGDYRTVTGQPAFLNWRPGFPMMTDDCVELSIDDAGFKTFDCTVMNEYLCEWDGRPVVTTNF